MPIPKPKTGESQDAFISRCMSAIADEYDDNDQALAICFQKWRDKDKKSIDLTIERRIFDGEFRALADQSTVEGYAAVFDEESEPIFGSFIEVIAHGAFRKTIKENDIRALINHDPNLILGRTTNETLRLKEDKKGLKYEVDLPDTTYARDLKESILRGDITQNSFGFQTVKDEWSKDGKTRTLREVRLYDISPVTFPAYPQTSLQMRLQDIGIDYEALNVAVIRINRGIILNSDVDLIESTIEILEQCLPKTEEPVVEDHSDADEEPNLEFTLVQARVARLHARQILGRR